MRCLTASTIAFAFLTRPAALPAQTTDTIHFDRNDAMIPMRHGVRLETVICRPKGRTEALPMLLNRTPYGVGGEERWQLKVLTRVLIG